MPGKRWMKKITIAILMAALVIGAVPANEAQAASKPKLNVTSLKMKAGQSKQLKVKNSHLVFQQKVCSGCKQKRKSYS